MNKLKTYLLAALFVFGLASPLVAVTTSEPVNAARCQSARLFGIPAWYRGMTKDENNSCVIRSPEELGGISNFIWRIVLNVIEIVLVLTAYVAFAFVLWGGFQFIIGGGNASKIEAARKTIFNAVIGLIISLGAVAIINFVFGLFGDATPNDLGIVELSETDLLQNILNLVYFVIGVVTVVTVIIAGIMYTVSAGDAAKTTRAKNMILFAVIGLVIAVSASVITNFIIDRF